MYLIEYLVQMCVIYYNRLFQVKQRARSLTPDWSSLSSRTETGSFLGLSSESRDEELSYVRSKYLFCLI